MTPKRQNLSDVNDAIHNVQEGIARTFLNGVDLCFNSVQSNVQLKTFVDANPGIFRSHLVDVKTSAISQYENVKNNFQDMHKLLQREVEVRSAKAENDDENCIEELKKSVAQIDLLAAKMLKVDQIIDLIYKLRKAILDAIETANRAIAANIH